jgi:uncharacterized repeat protein (TIGR01451 family)
MKDMINFSIFLLLFLSVGVPTALYADADLSLTKVATPETAAEGDTVVFTITATNNGPDPADGVSVVDPLPEGLTPISAEATQGSCSGDGTIDCALGSLSPGASVTVSIVALVNFLEIGNSATVESDESDPDPSNNTAAATVSPAVGGCQLSR